jgi:uncharacterized protein
MADLTASEPAAPAEARPVDGGERLVLLDVLRGFALCGVFIANVFVWFNGTGLVPQEPAREALLPPLEAATTYAFHFFIHQKFFALFAFMFGLGFSVQLQRAEARGTSVVPFYLRRMAALLLIGCVHALALWYGDILTTYALAGFLLLLFRNRSDRTLLIGAVALLLFAFAFSMLQKSLPLLFQSREAVEAAAQASEAQSKALRVAALGAYSQGTWLQTCRANAGFFVERYANVGLATILALPLSRFLLGLWVGRRKLFHDVASNRRLFRRILLWGLVFGVLGNGGVLLVRALTLQKLVPEKAPWLVLMRGVQEAGVVGLAAFYVAGLALLFLRPVWRKVLAVLAPVGQMALTNYLSQSVIALLLFNGYGLGLIGQTRRVTCVLLPLGIFCVQVLLSHLWLARFRFGPVEWLWRSMTYGRLQPMRRKPLPAVQPAPTL